MICLAAAYYLAVTVADPVSALGMFFIAVILVIVGTYLIMIASSVLFCRLLQKISATITRQIICVNFFYGLQNEKKWRWTGFHLYPCYNGSCYARPTTVSLYFGNG